MSPVRRVTEPPVAVCATGRYGLVLPGSPAAAAAANRSYGSGSRHPVVDSGVSRFVSSHLCLPLSLAFIAAAALQVSPPDAHARKTDRQPLALGGLTVSPGQLNGFAARDLGLGRVELHNSSPVTYRVEVAPALLAQARSGVATPDARPQAVRAAQRHMVSDTKSFVLRPGASKRVTAKLVTPTATHNFYGALTFHATPVTRAKQGASLNTAFWTGPGVLLRPAAKHTHSRASLDACFVRQAGVRQLSYVVPVRNRGNIALLPAGSVVVRRAGVKRVVSTAKLEGKRIYPRFVVDQVARQDAKRLLPKGDYVLSARMKVGRRTLTTSCSMRLAGPNTLASSDARLLELAPPLSTRGEPTPVQASYRNTGNITFEPRAQIVIRAADGAGKGKVWRTLPMRAARTAPHQTGRISGIVPELPTGGRYEFQLRLLDEHGRELDQAVQLVTQRPPASLRDRLPGWLLPALAAFVLLVALTLYRRRTERRRVSAANARIQRTAKRHTELRVRRMAAEGSSTHTINKETYK